MVSEPPRPSVVTSEEVETPWKPATSTILPSSRAARMRSALTSRMRARVCEVSVTIPACEPVSEMASWPRSLITIAASAHEIRSPVESSMSISRGCGRGETSCGHRHQLVGGLAARGEDGDHAVAALGRATIRPAARLMRSASATEVPPNFMTTVWSASGMTSER